MHPINPTKIQRQLTERTDYILNQENITYAELARDMKKTRSHITDIMKNCRITLKFLEGFARATGYELEIKLVKRENGKF